MARLNLGREDTQNRGEGLSHSRRHKHIMIYCLLFFFCLNDSAAAFTCPRRRYAQSDLSIIGNDDLIDVGGVDPPSSIRTKVHTNLSIISSSSSRSRRWVVSSIVSLLSSSSSIALLPSQQKIPLANAAPPLTAEIVDGIAARLERTVLRPKPAKVLRSRLNLDFAILLMRSSYNALDVLDVVPMEQFQRDFFLLREAEYKPYADQLGMGVLQQGDLADPVSNVYFHVSACVLKKECLYPTNIVVKKFVYLPLHSYNLHHTLSRITLTSSHLHNMQQSHERLVIHNPSLRNSSQ